MTSETSPLTREALLRRVAQQGWVWPDLAQPIGAYQPAVLVGDWVVASGQLPTQNGQRLAVGSVPSMITLEKAQAAAGQAAVNALAAVESVIDCDWSRLVGVVRIGVFVHSDATFTEQHKVANGASQCLFELLGPLGRHARTAVGVNALPLGACVEVELMVAIREARSRRA